MSLNRRISKLEQEAAKQAANEHVRFATVEPEHAEVISDPEADDSELRRLYGLPQQGRVQLIVMPGISKHLEHLSASWTVTD